MCAKAGSYILKARIEVKLSYDVMFMFCYVLLYQMHIKYKKNFDWWDKTRWHKGIPYINMARINFYCIAIVHSEWRMLRKKWQSLNYSFINLWRRKVEDFCAIVHVYAWFFHILEQRIGFAQQTQVKAKLVEYKYDNKLVF